MIKHGILSSQVPYDTMVHEVNFIDEIGSLVKVKKINWKLTQVPYWWRLKK